MIHFTECKPSLVPSVANFFKALKKEQRSLVDHQSQLWSFDFINERPLATKEHISDCAVSECFNSSFLLSSPHK